MHGVGKIDDLFAGVGVSEAHPGATNAQALDERRRSCSRGSSGGLVFANLIETDQLYGHRKDAAGLRRRAARDRRARGRDARRACAPEDLLIVTADHGVDPGPRRHRPHARVRAAAGGERARCSRRAAGGRLGGARHDGPLADVGATVLRWLAGASRGRAEPSRGSAFIS